MHAIDVSSTPPTWAGIITAASALFIALGGLIGGVAALIKVLLPIRNTGNSNAIKLDGIHVIVNQQRTDMTATIAMQGALLRYHGIEPPPPIGSPEIPSPAPGNGADETSAPPPLRPGG